MSRSAKEKIQRTAVGPNDPKQETTKAKKANQSGHKKVHACDIWFSPAVLIKDFQFHF
jgi:hypothetical protein